MRRNDSSFDLNKYHSGLSQLEQCMSTLLQQLNRNLLAVISLVVVTSS